MTPTAKPASAALQRDEMGGTTCPPLFIQLNQLLSTAAGLEWREKARWIKFEEKVEEDGERWSMPHVPVLCLHSLFQLRTCLQEGMVLLDLEALSFKEIIDKALSGQPEEAELQPELKVQLAALLLRQPRHQPSTALLQRLAQLSTSPCRGRAEGGSEPRAQLSATPLKEQLRNQFQKKIPPGAEAAHVAVGEVEFLEKPFAAFIRLRRGVALGSLAEVALPSRFLFILLGPHAKGNMYHEVGRAMATLLTDELFQRVAWQAEHREDLVTGMEAFLDELAVLPPGKWDPSAHIPPPSCVPSPHRRTTMHPPDWQSQHNGDMAAAADRAGLGCLDSREELERTGRLFGGLLRDIRRKMPWYRSDFSDALHPQCLSAVLYIYLVTVTNAITFGGMLGEATANMQGVLESFLGTAFAGSIFCLFAGQPLTILSSTGPVLVFERLLFSFSQDHGLDYLEFRLWIGLWVAFFGLVLVATEASHLVRYFTRFTEEGFCALISLIFIHDALKKMWHLADTFPINWQYRLDDITSYSCICNLSSLGHSSAGNDTQLPSSMAPWQPPAALAGLSRTQCLGQGGHLLGTSCHYVPDITLVSFLLFGGTFLSCAALKRFRSSRYFPVGVRNLVSDFAIILAILTSCAVDATLGLETPKLLVPTHEPCAGLDCPALWSQPVVDLPGVRRACCPCHHSHFHGPADHSCHPKPQGVQAAERGRLSPGPPLCLPPDGRHLCHWPPLVCLSHRHLVGTHGEPEEGEHNLGPRRAPRVPGHQGAEADWPGCLHPDRSLCFHGTRPQAHPDAGAVRGLPAHGGGSAEQHPGPGEEGTEGPFWGKRRGKGGVWDAEEPEQLSALMDQMVWEKRRDQWRTQTYSQNLRDILI
ncbi:anion exchange protein 4 isoform 8-T9 [Porphyrio hochstetteri]